MNKSGILRPVITIFICLILALSASAQELSVRNKVYKGESKGRGLEMLVRLDEMAKALDLPALQTEAGWSLGGVVIPTTAEDDAVYVKVSDLTAAGAKVTLNTQLNTIDVHRSVAKKADDPAPQAGGFTMVHWTADW